MNLIKIKKANQTLQAWIQGLSRPTNWNAPRDTNQTFCAWNDAWRMCLSKVQGSQEKRASRINNTVNELRTQLTPQFAKSASSASGSARTQAGATHVPGGFTIAELLIATSIFSVVLLVGAAAVTQLGRSYYKGVTVTQTQQAAKQIIQNVSSNIRLSSTVSPINSAASDDRKYYCVGGHRYSFKLFNLVSTSDHDNSTKFGLIADEPSGDGCGNPFDGSAPLVKPAELLGNNMRLLAFSITAVGSSTTTYSVNVTVAFGADNVLSDPNSPDAQCQGSGNITQFCAITRLSTVVYQGSNI